jgi:hypothetical protein
LTPQYSITLHHLTVFQSGQLNSSPPHPLHKANDEPRPFHATRLNNTPPVLPSTPHLPNCSAYSPYPLDRHHGRRPPTQTRGVHSSKGRTKEKRRRSSKRRRQQLFLAPRHLPRPNLRPHRFQCAKLFRDEEESCLGIGKTELDES